VLGTLLVIVLLSAVGPAAGFREDEVQCEEAFAHLLECCDEFTSNLQCYFSDQGCDSPTYPDLDVVESRHVQSLSCSEIRATDYCSVTYAEPEPL
jgi:hypothetical protein